MKIYMMLIRSYPSIAIGSREPNTYSSGKYSFGGSEELDKECFGIQKKNEPELFNYLTNKFNIPDSDKGFIEVEL